MPVISELMTHRPITIGPDESVRSAFQRMNGHEIRHLPVVSNGTLVGILSDRDIRHCLPPIQGGQAEMALALRLLSDPIRGHMTESVEHLPPDADAKDAAQLMIRHRIGCIPVVEMPERKVVGVVTYHDLLKLLCEG